MPARASFWPGRDLGHNDRGPGLGGSPGASAQHLLTGLPPPPVLTRPSACSAFVVLGGIITQSSRLIHNQWRSRTMESGVRSQDTSSVYSVRETADARGASERGQAASDLHCRTGWLAHGPVSTGGGAAAPGRRAPSLPPGLPPACGSGGRPSCRDQETDSRWTFCPWKETPGRGQVSPLKKM